MLYSLTEANPLERFWDLRRDFDRLFDDAFPFTGPARDSFVPEFDVDEDENGISIRAEIPGVTPENLKVSLHGRVLSIEGTRESTRDEGADVHRCERTFGRFVRSFQLPDHYDIDAIDARHENGVLQLKVAKRETAKPRSIRIESA